MLLKEIKGMNIEKLFLDGESFILKTMELFPNMFGIQKPTKIHDSSSIVKSIGVIFD